VDNAKVIYLEISGMCNAKCPYCAQRRLRLENHFGGIMSPELFSQLIDHLLRLQIVHDNCPSTVNLYNWGEPFLNPKINDILRFLASRNLNATISSNLIAKANIHKENYPVIEGFVFSISGFDQKSYGRIHGANLSQVLENFEELYADFRLYSPKTRILIAWHRYLFNEKQYRDAFKYFDRPGITFAPTVAYLNDCVEMWDFVKGNLPRERMASVKKDISLSHMRKGIAYSKSKSKDYYCPAWDHITLDETGQLLLCCGTTRYDSKYILGNLLEMSKDEIWQRKKNHPVCKECVSSGLAQWLFDPPGFHSKPLLLRFRARSALRALIKKVPNGDKIIKGLG
jgi:MoaA/NifB/PqqE/SkfB family radical SAM enzyme